MLDLIHAMQSCWSGVGIQKNGVQYAQSPYFETVGQQAGFAPNFEIETNLLYLHQT